jgi:hypothetical protein
MNAPTQSADLEQILRAAEGQAAWCRGGGAPFTADILDVVRDNLANGGAINPLVVPWPGNPLGDALVLRVIGALHFMVRTGLSPALARFYPGHGNAAWDKAEVERAVEDAVTTHVDLVRNILSSPPQTNETGRSAILMPGYAEIAKHTGLPLSVLELGASAGLNLMWDRYAYRYGDRFVGASDAPLTIKAEWRGPWSGVTQIPRVVARRGCDRSPIDLTAPGNADRLTAYVWPEQTERLARLQAAIALAQHEKPQLDKADAGDWLEQHLAKPMQGAATVVAHTIVSQYFTKETRARVRAIIDAAGARATKDAPLAWLSMEQYAMDQLPELRLTLWPGGETRKIAHAHPHGAWIEWLAA